MSLGDEKVAEDMRRKGRAEAIPPTARGWEVKRRCDLWKSSWAPASNPAAARMRGIRSQERCSIEAHGGGKERRGRPRQPQAGTAGATRRGAADEEGRKRGSGAAASCRRRTAVGGRGRLATTARHCSRVAATVEGGAAGGGSRPRRTRSEEEEGGKRGACGAARCRAAMPRWTEVEWRLTCCGRGGSSRGGLGR